MGSAIARAPLFMGTFKVLYFEPWELFKCALLAKISANARARFYGVEKRRLHVWNARRYSTRKIRPTGYPLHSSSHYMLWFREGNV